MSDFDKFLRNVNIPDVLMGRRGVIDNYRSFEAERAAMLALLENHMYGKMPKRPVHLKVEPISIDRGFAAGRATLSRFMIHAECEDGTVSFPFYSAIPNVNRRKPPVIIHLKDTPDIPDRSEPTEELTDNGFAVFGICASDVVPRNDDFRRGNAKVLVASRRSPASSGKLAMWAWAAMRVIDYVETLTELDTKNLGITGLGILGGAVLLASAYDERIKYAAPVCAGTCADALIRVGNGDRFSDIIKREAYLFCPKFGDYAWHEEKLPFDQHFLLSLIAPRRILILAAEGDYRSCPKSQFASLCLADRVYKLYGLDAIPQVNEFPKTPIKVEGHCMFSLRSGLRYFARDDWHTIMKFIKKRSEKAR